MKKMKEGKKYTEKDDEISKPKLHTKTCWAEIKSDIQKTNYRNWLKINMKQFLYFRFIFLYFIRNIILYKNIEKLIFWIRKQNWANFGHRDLLFSNNEGRHILQLALSQKSMSAAKTYFAKMSENFFTLSPLCYRKNILRQLFRDEKI